MKSFVVCFVLLSAVVVSGSAFAGDRNASVACEFEQAVRINNVEYNRLIAVSRLNRKTQLKLTRKKSMQDFLDCRGRTLDSPFILNSERLEVQTSRSIGDQFKNTPGNCLYDTKDDLLVARTKKGSIQANILSEVDAKNLNAMVIFNECAFSLDQLIQSTLWSAPGVKQREAERRDSM